MHSMNSRIFTDFQFPPLWGFCELTEGQLSTENCIRSGVQQSEPARWSFSSAGLKTLTWTMMMQGVVT